MCSAPFPPEGAAPPNSSPKRGLTRMHSPSPPDPRWSRRIACVSPPPSSVAYSAIPPFPSRKGCGGLRQRPGWRTPPLARSARSGSWWIAEIHFSRYKMWDAARSLSHGLLTAPPSRRSETRCRLPARPSGKPRAAHITLPRASDKARCT